MNSTRTACLLVTLASLLILITTDPVSAQNRGGGDQETAVDLPLSSSAADVPSGTNANWESGFANAGTDGVVRTSVFADGKFYIGGSFRTVGGLVVNGLAVYDGVRWSGLGGGAIGGDIETMLVVGSKLYVAGQFYKIADLQTWNIAVYDIETGQWSALGQGVGGVAQGGGVFSMTHDGQNLYVGGSFIVAGNIVAVNVARYDGERWHRVGTGADRAVTALHYVDGDVYAAGSFRIIGDESIDRFARFDVAEQKWSPVAGLPLVAGNTVRVMASDDDYLYVGGDFQIPGFNNIARLDRQSETWDGMNRGVTGSVRAIVRRGDRVYVGGDIRTVPSIPGSDGIDQPRDFAVWLESGGTWTVLPRTSAVTGQRYPAIGPIKSHRNVGSVFDFDRFLLRNDQTGRILTMADAGDGRLYIGGDFDLAGPVTLTPEGVPNAGAIDPDPEVVLSANITVLLPGDTLFGAVGSRGLDNGVTALASTDEEIFVGGSFLRAGDIAVGSIARYDRASGLWSDMGGGLRAAAGVPSVRKLWIHEEDLYVAGSFTSAGGTAISGLARYEPGSGTWSSVGGRSFDLVTDLVSLDDTLMVVGRHGLSYWDGSSWTDVNSTIDGVINGVIVDGRGVYVGGEFTTIDGLAARNVARYNLSSDEWSSLGDGIPGPVSDVAVVAPNIYFCGDFRFTTPFAAEDIVRFERGPQRFAPVGAGLIPVPSDPDDNESSISEMIVGTYGLYVAGQFHGFGQGSSSTRASNIALFDGDTWRTLGNGLAQFAGEASVEALDVDEERLYVGGRFDLAGQKVAGNLATWVFPQEEKEGIEDDDKPTGAVASTSATVPDDRFWDDRFDPAANPAGVDDEVFAVAASNDTIFAGGAFTRAVGINVGNLAMWDGTDWNRLQASGQTGDGVDGFVFSLALDADRLYVGGQFDRAGDIEAHGIALWNRRDRTWAPLGDGISSDGGSTPFISDILIDGSDVYVAGLFTNAGGTAAASIARWDGSTWHPLAEGIDGTVNALSLFEGDLYAAGTFSRAGTTTVANIARYDGTAWHAVGTGVDGFVNDMEIFGDQLLLAGRFTVTDTGATVGLGSWDGSEVTTFTHQTDKIEEARSILVHGDRIYVGGNYSFTPDPSISEQRFGTGLISNVGFQSYLTDGISPWTPMVRGTDGAVNALGVAGDRIVVAGSFLNADPGGPGEVEAASIAVASVDGRDWQALVSARLSGGITAMSLSDGTLFGVGDFSDPQIPGYSGVTNQIARLGSSGWRGIDGSIEGIAATIQADSDRFFIGGRFIVAERTIAVNVLSWNRNEETFAAISPGSGVANILGTSIVHSVEQHDDQIYIGGVFSVADTIAAANIVRHDRSTGSWHPMGDGLNGPVRAIEITDDGTIYVGGEFVERSGDRLNGVARWDGTQWQPLGDGVRVKILDIAATDDYLYVGGEFDTIAGIVTPNVARYNLAEDRWEAVGHGLDKDFIPGVEALEVIDGTLFAGGFFNHSGPDSLSNVARWDGWIWSPLGSGIDFAVYDIEGDRRDIYFGGTFTKAGGKPSKFIALWHDPTLSVEYREIPTAGSITGGPNPFEQSITIRFDLPNPDDISLEIVDLSGRHITTLYDGPAPSGEQTIDWHPPSTLPNGTYLIRLVGEHGVVTEKIVRRR